MRGLTILAYNLQYDNNKNMPEIKKTRKDTRKAIVDIAKQLFKEGLTTREVAERVRRSHTWVAYAVKEK